VGGFTNADQSDHKAGVRKVLILTNYQPAFSSSEKSNAKDELGIFIIYILCNLSCDIYFHNKNGFHVLIVSTITVSAYTSVCPFTFYYILYTT